MVDDYVRIPTAMLSYRFGDFQTQINREIIGHPYHWAFFVILIGTVAFAIRERFRGKRPSMWNTNNDFYISSEVLKKNTSFLAPLESRRSDTTERERFALNEAIIQAKMQFI